MDAISVLIGLIIGLLVGAAVAWKISQNQAASKSQQMASSEAELKALLAQQAQSHITTTKSAINTLKQQVEHLNNSILSYETSLSQPSQRGEKSNFYGEQASIFLRNSSVEVNKPPKSEIENAQPRDFANDSSGLFVGKEREEKVIK
ncbi:ZapG family protein [Agaribacter flavus]|uniref:ZapG family protein n=1 Tax=Agaribacter flavus TaxID=1902781 RepID=A0ABV7FS07_9ALTE